MTPALLDKINSVVDFACLVPALLDFRLVLRTKEVSNISLVGRAYYFIIALWWIFYFNALGQPWSVVVVVVWAILFVLDIVLVLRWRKPRAP